MIQEILEILPGWTTRLHGPIFFVIAGVGLLIAVVGARFSRAIISLALVSGGTVVGLHMPKWFGWGVDPMGTAFGMAILLGISGYVLTTMWEGVFFASLLAGFAALSAWIRLAPHQTWQLPPIDWSETAIETASHIRLSLPSALTTFLPVVLGIGATVGALIMVIWQKLGRVLFYALLGVSLFTIGTVAGIRQIRPDWLNQIPRDAWVQSAFLALFVIFTACVQWLLMQPGATPRPVPMTDNKLHFNQFVAKGPAMRVQVAEKKVLISAAGGTKAVPRPAPANPTLS